ncbi:MAG: SlyX protein [Pelagibacterium sp. SCN 64-44]|nr:MAG: SlyX protein [Pelagibacterium sp. SCN 64-44]
MTDIALHVLIERLDALETRIAFQDHTIEELNDTITGQWQQIDLLTRKMAQMEEQLRSGAYIADPATEKPPPHY